MFKGILKEQTIQVGIGFVFIVVLLGTFILPEWMSNNFMYGLSSYCFMIVYTYYVVVLSFVINSR